MLTSDSEFALTSTVNFLFLSWVWSSPKTDSFFLVPAADTHDALGGAGGEGELVVRPVVPGAPRRTSGLLADVGVEPWRHGCRRRRRR
ncbi:hypothetical protein EE612_003775, partial [Oryza sativa]